MLYILAPIYINTFAIRIKGIITSYQKRHKERLKAEALLLLVLIFVGIFLFNLLAR
jgi:hypothetical protein